MARRGTRALIVGILAVGCLVLLPQSSTAAPALVISRGNVIAGETVTITGSVGGKTRRQVILQRRDGDTWIRIRATRSRVHGAFRFTYRPPTSGPALVRVRVFAPATRAGGRTVSAIATGGRSLTRVAPSARISAPELTVTDEAFPVQATFSPVRQGRATEVQRWDGEAWSTVAAGKQDGSGRSTFEIDLDDAAAQRLRVRTLAASGAPEKASAGHEILAITPEQDTRPPKAPTGVVAVGTDRAIELSWDPTTVSNRLGKHLYVASKLDGPWVRLTGEPVGPDETSYVVRGLSNGVDYVFGVSSLYLRTAGVVESSAVFTGTIVPVAAAADREPGTDDACGPEQLKADGSVWRCTLSDDFDGDTFDRTHWTPQQVFASGTNANLACYRNTPETVSVADGVLSLSVVKVEEPVSCTFGKLSGTTDIIAGSLMTYQRFTQRYGRFEARIKNTATTFPGLQEAFWMWPDDRLRTDQIWPFAGEIDVSETYSNYSYLTVPFLHYGADAGGPQPGLNTAYCLSLRGEWNTYTLIWEPERIEIQVNGTTCLVNTSADAAFAKPYILALTALLGTGPNAYDGRAPLPATMQVDYVKVWE